MARFDDNLDYRQVRPGVAMASYVDGPVEVMSVRLKAGTTVPAHRHSANVVHLVLEGRLKFDNGEIVTAIGDYKCGGWEYRVIVLEDTTMLIIQPPGTDFEWVDED